MNVHPPPPKTVPKKEKKKKQTLYIVSNCEGEERINLIHPGIPTTLPPFSYQAKDSRCHETKKEEKRLMTLPIHNVPTEQARHLCVEKKGE